jgi:hypothetical protein
MAEAELLRVTVVYALPEQQHLFEVRVPPLSSVNAVISASGLLARFPQLPHPTACAIYGQVVSGEHKVSDGDRIEVLRPLHMDPKEARRRAARADR